MPKATIRIDQSGPQTLVVKQSGGWIALTDWQHLTDVIQVALNVDWCSVRRSMSNPKIHLLECSRMPTMSEWDSAMNRLEAGLVPFDIDIVDEFRRRLKDYWLDELTMLRKRVGEIKSDLANAD